jgi:hypothetical protein
MLLVNAKYRGRFHEKAKVLVQQGIRVGIIWTQAGRKCQCHVCQTWFDCPLLSITDHNAWGECPNCHLPFVFVDYTKIMKG